jgi:hypothetical protein
VSRYPYDTFARFHSDAAAPIIGIRWYFTDLPFLSGPTLLNNRYLNKDQHSPLLVGEVPVWQAPRRENRQRTPNPKLDGSHVCHPEWFATGQPWPVDTDPVDYDEDGIPTCCFPPEDGGGLGIGGEVGDTFSVPTTSDGGLMIGGAVLDVFSVPTSVDGGLGIGGAVLDVFSVPTSVDGGLGIGGAVLDVFSVPTSVDGGLGIGGAVGDDFIPPGATLGGLGIGGQVGDAFTVTDGTAGGLGIGGTVGDAYTLLEASAGGLGVGGRVGDSFTLLEASAGGLGIGGQVPEHFGFADALAGGVGFGGVVVELWSITDAIKGGIGIGGAAGDVYRLGVVDVAGPFHTITLPGGPVNASTDVYFDADGGLHWSVNGQTLTIHGTPYDGLSPLAGGIHALNNPSAAALLAGSAYYVSMTADSSAKLPPPTAGARVEVVVTGALAHAFTLLPNGSETINGATSRILFAGESAVVESDGANWFKVSGRSIPCICTMTLNANQGLTPNAASFIALNNVVKDFPGTMGSPANFGMYIRRPGNYDFNASVAFTGASVTGGVSMYTLVNANAGGNVGVGTFAQRLEQATAAGIIPQCPCWGNRDCALNDYILMVGYIAGACTNPANVYAEPFVSFLTAEERNPW